MAQQEVAVETQWTVPEDHIFENMKNQTAWEATGAYSGLSPGWFDFTPDEGRIAEIERLIVYIEDTGAGVGNFPADKYGYDLVFTLGIYVQVVGPDTPGGVEVILDLTPDETVETNANWSALCWDTSLLGWSGSKVRTVASRWTFAKSGAPLYIDSTPGHRLRVGLQDDCTNLDAHRFAVQGRYIK